MHKKNKKGFTLIELAIVLGALGFLLGGIWVIVGVVWDNYKFNRFKEDLFQTVQNVQTYYSQVGRIPGSDGVDITKDLDDDARRLIPVTMRLDPKTHRGDINHELFVAVGGSFHVLSESSGRRFRVELSNLDKPSCEKLLMQFPVLLPELGVRRMAATSGSANVNPYNPVNPGSGTTLPLTLIDAGNWCSSLTTNTVSYDFTIRP